MDKQIEVMEKRIQNLEAAISAAMIRKKELKAKHTEMIAKRKLADLQAWGKSIEAAGISIRSISNEMMTEIVREINLRLEKSGDDKGTKEETLSDDMGESETMEKISTEYAESGSTLDEEGNHPDDLLTEKRSRATDRRDKKRKFHVDA